MKASALPETVSSCDLSKVNIFCDIILFPHAEDEGDSKPSVVASQKQSSSKIGILDNGLHSCAETGGEWKT